MEKVLLVVVDSRFVERSWSVERRPTRGVSVQPTGTGSSTLAGPDQEEELHICLNQQVGVFICFALPLVKENV